MTTTSKQSATQIAFEGIKQLIFTGELIADSNHLESELATRLGLSRTPVREATLMLEAHGLLEVQPRRGIRIKSISPEEMADVFEILTELECLATRRAASAGLTQAQLKELHAAMIDMEDALAENNRNAWAKANEAFHTELVRLGGNPYIINMVSMVNDQVRRACTITLHLRPLPIKSNDSHRKLYSAIEIGDEQLAEEIHREHLQQTSSMKIAILKQSGLRRI